MAAYVIADRLEVRDATKMASYRAAIGAIVEKFGGRFLVAGGSLRVVEGDWQPTFPVVIEFPSMAQVKRWYDSEEYRDLKALRHAHARTNMVFVEGIVEPPSGVKE